MNAVRTVRTAVARALTDAKFTPCCGAGLLVFMAGYPALAQPGAELEIGGGYHAALDLGSDWFTVPSTPTVDVRATSWVSDRWGVAARGLIGLGGVLRGTTWDVERRRPTYFQILVRYRAVGSERNGLHVGIGGGLWGYIQDDHFEFGPHFLGPGGAGIESPHGAAQHPVRRLSGHPSSHSPDGSLGVGVLMRSGPPARRRGDKLPRTTLLVALAGRDPARLLAAEGSAAKRPATPTLH